MTTDTVTFDFEPLRQAPVLDESPNHLRMATSYRDRAGRVHLFADFIPAEYNDINTWQSHLEYYTSDDLLSWTRVGTAVTADPDRPGETFGMGSPGVLATQDRIYLFYAGRSAPQHGAPINNFANRDEPGYMTSHICLAVAPTDANGAPAGPFERLGVVLQPSQPWCTLRVDDPCPVRVGDHIRLYFKGMDTIRAGGQAPMSHVKVGVAETPFDDLAFATPDAPLFSVSAGGEQPNVFRYHGQWHMFYRLFPPHEGSVWQHFTSEDGFNWQLHDDAMFNCAGPTPGTGATDMMPIYGFDGALADPPSAMACGMEEDVLKLWAYRLAVRENR